MLLLLLLVLQAHPSSPHKHTHSHDTLGHLCGALQAKGMLARQQPAMNCNGHLTGHARVCAYSRYLLHDGPKVLLRGLLLVLLLLMLLCLHSAAGH